MASYRLDMAMTTPDAESAKLDRRRALKLFAGGSAAVAVTAKAQVAALPAAPPLDPAQAVARGTLTDPNLVEPAPSSWPRLLTAEEKREIDVLADVILPADEHGPAASQNGIASFFDEWLSAPYAPQMADRELVRGGLAWLNTHSWKRHGQGFVGIAEAEKVAMCEEICRPTENASLALPVKFFARFRDLCVSGYYTTGVGFNAIGYAGNLPMPKWEGPPAELLAKLGLND
jgi:hypothetical protein